jgi:hypothetical protein
MNELKRLAYLQAMGTASYVSVRQLPGAALTRRLAVVRQQPAAARDGQVKLADSATGRRPSRATAINPPQAASAAARRPVAPDANPGVEEMPPRFSLAAIFCGHWLWLEELAGVPFAAQQLQLVQAMASALGLAASANDGLDTGSARPEVTRFDWPIHNNRQLDLGEAAACASAAGFIQRKLERPGCRGLVLLGRDCEARVALDQLECERLVRTLSTADMLREPLLKKQAWRDLQVCIRQA